MQRNVGVIAGLLLASGAVVGWSAPAKKAAVKKYGAPTRIGLAALPAPISPEDQAEINALLIGAKQVDNTRRSTPPPAVEQAGPANYVIMHAEFQTPEARQAAAEGLAAKGASTLTAFDRWADLLVNADDPAARAAPSAAPGVVWVEVGRELSVPPPVTAKQAGVRSNAENIVRGGISGLKGKGVLVAVVDSGIDFRHPDFITKDASGKPVSRIRAIWDTTATYNPSAPGSKAPFSFPNGTSIGVLYTRDQLNAELQANGTAIPPLDTNGHGTSCAGIAAGNGGGSPEFTGVAPEADIIGVRIGPGPGLPNSYLMGAISDWLDREAGAQPLVVSCSFGGQYGGRDGSRVQERHINARFSPDRKGRALVIAAGNEAANNLHAEATFSDTAPATLTWKAPSGGKLYLYFNSGDTDISLSTPAGAPLHPKNGNGYVYPLTKQVVWSVSVPNGDAEIKVTAAAGKSGKVDAYITGSGQFTGSCLSVGRQIGTPGTVENAITVGSYDWNSVFRSAKGQMVLGDVVRTNSDGSPAPLVIGKLSSYSNPGYRRDGAVKPEIVAPGQFHIAACPLQDIPGKLRDATGKYQPFNGTSAATPYVSGVLALVMEKKPGITLGEVKSLLTAAASRTADTGATPNAGWGYGKLNLDAVQKLIASVR